MTGGQAADLGGGRERSEGLSEESCGLLRRMG